MKRNVFFACLIAIIISALVVPANPVLAYEPANLVKLTPFTISLLEEDFDKFALVHPILLLETEKSANVHIRIQNHDVQETHEIKFFTNFGDPSIADKVTISFDRQSISLVPNSFGEVLMHITAKTNLNETYYSTVGIAAYSTTFGAVGKSFHLVVGKNVTEFDTSYLDLYIREGLPGNYFNLDEDTSRAHIEELWGERIYLPSYLPENYEINGVEGDEWGVRLVYSTFEITNKTDLTEFWRNGGMLILYNNSPPDFDEYLLPWIAYSEGQEIMVNDFVGTAVEQREQVTVGGTKFKSPSVLQLYKNDFSIEIMAVMPLSEVLKIASSLDSMNNGMTIKLHKPFYWADECIHVSGTVGAVLDTGIPIKIRVLDPENVVRFQAYTLPNQDGTYSLDFILKESGGVGPYIVTAAYGLTTVKTSFFVPEVMFGTDPFEPEYFLTNGCVLSYEVKPNSTSLIVSVSTNATDGELNITMPRALIDARTNGNDDDFVVLIDGEKIDFQETNVTMISRTLAIPVHASAKEIEIIGTHVISEFPVNLIVIAAIGLSGALIALRVKRKELVTWHE